MPLKAGVEAKAGAGRQVAQAWCVELQRVVTMREAQAAYFAQVEPRRRLSFLCADPVCRERAQARIQALHDDRLFVDQALPVSAAFTQLIQSPHDPACRFEISRQAAELLARDGATVAGEFNAMRRLAVKGALEIFDVYRPAVSSTMGATADPDLDDLEGGALSVDEAAERVAATLHRLRTQPMVTRRLFDVIACYTALGAVDRQKALIRVPGGKPTSYANFLQPLSRFTEDGEPAVRVGGARVTRDDSGFVIRFHDRVALGGERCELILRLSDPRIDESPLAGLLRAQLNAASGAGCHARVFFFGGVAPSVEAPGQAELRLTDLENLLVHPMRS